MTRTPRILRAGALAGVVLSALVTACGWSPTRPFEREAPQVNEAIGHLGDGGDARAANNVLADYLSTGACSEGSIGTPPRVKQRSNGSFDLGLALFKIAEAYGGRFGEETNDAGSNPQRTEQVECALKIVRAVATDPDQPIDLRARARYLEGNLLFLNGNYEEAVRAYDAALELAPGVPDSGPLGASDAHAHAPYQGDPVGLDAAWNRAIALRRIEDKKDAASDAPQDSPSDGSSGDGGKQNPDGGDQNQDGGKNKDAGQDGSSQNDDQKDGGKDSGGQNDEENKPKPNESQKDAGAPPPPSRQNQDERMLDQLENAPTVQQESARQAAKKRRGTRGMVDK